MYLVNALSINMFGNIDETISVKVTPVSLEQVKAIITENKDNFVSAIGHVDTARILSNMLEIEVAVSRANVKIISGDYAVVAQYVGPRLPEGATQLPEGAEIRFFVVNVE